MGLAEVAEKRAEPRLPAHFEVHYRVGGEQVRGWAYDISSGGLGLLGERSYPAGSEINVQFEGAGAKGSLLRVKGVVRWSSGQRMGVELVNVAPAYHQRILEIVERLAGSAKPPAGVSRRA